MLWPCLLGLCAGVNKFTGVDGQIGALITNLDNLVNEPFFDAVQLTLSQIEGKKAKDEDAIMKSNVEKIGDNANYPSWTVKPGRKSGKPQEWTQKMRNTFVDCANAIVQARAGLREEIKAIEVEEITPRRLTNMHSASIGKSLTILRVALTGIEPVVGLSLIQGATKKNYEDIQWRVSGCIAANNEIFQLQE